MATFYLKSKGSRNVGFMWLEDRVGTVGNAQLLLLLLLLLLLCCCAAVLRDCNPTALQLTNLMLFCVTVVPPLKK